MNYFTHTHYYQITLIISISFKFYLIDMFKFYICKNFCTRQFINNLELLFQNELDDNPTDYMVKYSITTNTIKNN